MDVFSEIRQTQMEIRALRLKLMYSSGYEVSIPQNVPTTLSGCSIVQVRTDAN